MKPAAQPGMDPVEQLLERANPRSAPPPGTEREVREAVRAQWLKQVGRRRRRFALVGLAATLVAGAMFALFLQDSEVTAPVEVAQIDKQFGSVYLVTEDQGLVQLANAQHLVAGQIVQTARAAGLGILVGGTSVRLDEDSRIEMQAADRLYLQRGRVYVDAPVEGTAVDLVIRTDQGSIQHLGTQFMVAIAGDELTVMVRDGKVRVDGLYYKTDASVGDQVTLRGTRRPVVDGVPGYGGLWRWAEALTPAPEIDGMPAARFLAWVSEETGYRLAFDDDAARDIAASTILKGIVDKDPRTELQLRLLTMDLAYDIDDARGEIRIRETRQ